MNIKNTIIVLVTLLCFVGLYLLFKPIPHSSTTKFIPGVKKTTVTIGILSQTTNKTYETSIIAMKKALLEKGYNPVYLQEEVNDPSNFPAVAKEYVDKAVDVIVANSTPATKAALLATATIPIVFGSVGDPVANGIVQSLDSSGNNVTGVSSLSVDLTPKRLDLLKQAKPFLQKVYFVNQPGEISSDNSRLKALGEAKNVGITIVDLPATNSAQVKQISLHIDGIEAGAILMSASGMIWGNVTDLIAAQNRAKIPLIGVDRTMVERGAVFSYGPDYTIVGKQVAALVDQILKGVKPRYLPIQRPKKIELVLNKSAAALIGLPLPDELLKRADYIIGSK